jgi:N-acetylglutamate synthase-like GNAT family acetyltransferase
MHYETTINNIFYSNNKDLLQIDVIYGYLSKESYWVKGIPKQIVENAINGSVCYAAYDNKKQIAFARIVTDNATFAFLADVFVITERQGNGIGKELMNFVMTDVATMGLRKIVLATRDAQDLYKKYGFKNLPYPERFMMLKFIESYEQE